MSFGISRSTINEPVDSIIVTHGAMRLAFPAGTSQADIDKRLKKIDAATRQARRLLKDPRPDLRMPRPSRVKVPSVDLMQGARVGDVVMPDDMLLAGLLAQAERTLKKWPDENPAEYAEWMAIKAKVATMPTERIEEVVASIMRCKRVASGKYAASLVWGVAELEARKGVTQGVASGLDWRAMWHGGAKSAHGPISGAPSAGAFRAAVIAAGGRVVVESGYLVGVREEVAS